MLEDFSISADCKLFFSFPWGVIVKCVKEKERCRNQKRCDSCECGHVSIKEWLKGDEFCEVVVVIMELRPSDINSEGRDSATAWLLKVFT